MNNALLSLKDVHKSFNGYRAVAGVSFNLAAGEVVGLAGPNGSGKSSVLNLISGVFTPDQGEIFFDGVNVTRLAPEQRTRLGLARTFQLAHPFPNMNVFENVLVALAVGKVRTGKVERERAGEILSATGLSDKKDWNTGKLSSGGLRRLEVARAMATDPKLLLLDEPFATLGVKEEEGLIKLLKELNGKGKSMLLVSHRPYILKDLTHRILVFEAGKIKLETRPEEIEAVVREGVEI